MKRSGRLLITFVLVGAILFAAGQGAFAGCHAFTISVNPSTVTEGGTVTVTVARDAAVNPSSVQVTSADESANAGADYDKVDRRISFTTETQQTFSLPPIKDDQTYEGTETFLLRLSNADGCQVNQRFTYGQATVTIADNDPAPAGSNPAASPAAKSAPKAEPSPSPSPTTSPASPAPASVESLPSPDTSPSPSPRALVAEEQSASSVPLIVGIVALLVAAVAGAGWWWLRRKPS